MVNERAVIVHRTKSKTASDLNESLAHGSLHFNCLNINYLGVSLILKDNDNFQKIPNNKDVT